jgi:spermidine synthase
MRIKADTIVENSKLKKSFPFSLVSIIIFLSFFASGFSALIYEIIWSRLFTLVFGNTVFAISTVLSAYMAGLAGGSFIFGRFVDKKSSRTIQIYALLELGIGAYALLLPQLINLSSPLYIWIIDNFRITHYALSFIRFIVSFLLVLPATILMGGTFPVLSKLITRKQDMIGWNSGLLYALNTFGAVFGCFLTSFVLVDAFGIFRTVQLAATINISISLCAWLIAIIPGVKDYFPGVNELQEEITPQSLEINCETGLLKAIPWLFALSGFASLAYEVLWTRMLIHFVGIDIQAFGIILSTFLAGICLGSFIFTKYLSDKKNSIFLFVTFEILIGLFAIFSIYVYSLKIPFVDVFSYSVEINTWLKFIRPLSVMILPSILMGATFPLVIRIYANNFKILGGALGSIYAFNTIGAIAGSFVAGFVLIPLVGVKISILLIAFLNIAIGLIVYFISQSARNILGVKPLILTSIFSIIICLCISFPYLYTPLIPGISTDNIFKVLYYKEDVSTSAAVIEEKSSGIRELRLNGKALAFTNPADLKIQKMLAHLPILLHKDPQDILIIGFGSGTTSGTAMLYNKNAVCVELEKAEIKTAKYFSYFNLNVLNNPGFKINIDDGRNWLLTKNEFYDVISRDSLPPKPSQNLFSSEFYELCKKRLNKNGVVCVFVPSVLCPNEGYFKSILGTFRSVFAHTSLWYMNPDCFLLIATDEELNIDVKRLADKMQVPQIKNDLSLIHLEDPKAFLSCFIMAEEQLDEYIKGAKIFKDDYPLGFLNTRKKNNDPVVVDILKSVIKFRSDIFRYLTNLGSNDSGKEEFKFRLKQYYEASKHLMIGQLFQAFHSYPEALDEFKLALSKNPDNKEVKFNMSLVLADMAKHIRITGELAQAFEYCLDALRYDGSNYLAHLELGIILEGSNKIKEAKQEYLKAIKLTPTGIPFAEERLRIINKMRRE